MDLSIYDQLAPYITGGLKKNGIHSDVRLLSCCLSLNHLGPAHL